MDSRMTMAGGPILLGVLIALTQYMGWSGSLHYLWALVAIAWGVWTYMGK